MDHLSYNLNSNNYSDFKLLITRLWRPILRSSQSKNARQITKKDARQKFAVIFVLLLNKQDGRK